VALKCAVVQTPQSVTSWYGIAVFLLFSFSVSLFSQLEGKRFRRRELPSDLGCWQVCNRPESRESGAVGGASSVVERRVLLVKGTLFRRTRLIQQVRHRDSVTGEVLSIEPEVTLERWFDGF
jgi:hypothetical protein